MENCGLSRAQSSNRHGGYSVDLLVTKTPCRRPIGMNQRDTNMEEVIPYEKMDQEIAMFLFADAIVNSHHVQCMGGVRI